MNSLCETVRSEIATAFGAESIMDWEVVHETPHSCNVRTPRFLITFYMDPRNQLVSSSVTFPGVGEEYKEALYSHIISRLFPSIVWNGQTGTGPLSRRIALEVENVRNILEAMSEENISPRDLLYFYLGYNCGHSDGSDYGDSALN